MAAEGGPRRRPVRGLGQRASCPGGSTALARTRTSPPLERAPQSAPRRAPRAPTASDPEPGVEEALVEDETGEAQLFGDIGLVLSDGLGHVRLTDEEEVAVLEPAPSGRLPVVRVAAEPALWRQARARSVAGRPRTRTNLSRSCPDRRTPGAPQDERPEGSPPRNRPIMTHRFPPRRCTRHNIYPIRLRIATGGRTVRREDSPRGDSPMK